MRVHVSSICVGVKKSDRFDFLHIVLHPLSANADNVLGDYVRLDDDQIKELDSAISRARVELPCLISLRASLKGGC